MTPSTENRYVPGVCNIGPAEIARRRRVGWLGAGATLALLAWLVASRAPAIARLAVMIPAAVAAAGFIQARLRFCANFGYRGIYNFDDVGEGVRIAISEASRRDRRKAYGIGLASGAVGLAAGLTAMLIPT